MMGYSQFSNQEASASAFMLSLQIHSELDYEDRLKYVETLMERVNRGDDLAIPLLEYVASIIEDYEDEHYPIESSTPGRMLAFYMEQHGHKQKDLADIATQSVISEILNDKRKPTAEQIKKLAAKYNINPSVFL
jgi:HTH-type transcriptional regulator/antitoxin HigA